MSFVMLIILCQYFLTPKKNNFKYFIQMHSGKVLIHDGVVSSIILPPSKISTRS